MILTRQMILSADDLKRELVSVPEWGGEVYVRALSGTEKDTFESSNFAIGDDGKASPTMGNVTARLAGLSICDEHGERLFSDADMTALGAKSGPALDRVFAVAKRLSGLGAKAVEDAKKNSPTTTDSASSTSSPES